MNAPHPLRALRSARAATDLAARRLLASRRATLASAGFAAACVVVAATDGFGVVRPLGLAGMLALGVAVAGSPGPERLRASALVELNGASPRFRRLLAVAEVAWLAAAGVVVGGAAAVAVAALTGDALRRWPSILACGLLAMAGAAVGSRAQLAGTVRPPEARLAREGVGSAVRLLAGAALVTAGALLPSLATDWLSLDAFLPAGLFLVGVGLVLVAPVLVRAVGAVVARAARTPAVRAAGTLVGERSAVLGPTAVLLSLAAVLVTVQGVLGLGLAEREDRRQAAIADGAAPAGTSPDQLVVEPSADRLSAQGSSDAADAAFVGSVLGDGTLVVDDSALDAIVAAAPRATAAAVRTLVTGTVVQRPSAAEADLVIWGQLVFVDREEPGRPAGDVAVATPDLLAALGLGGHQADIDAGRWLVLDPDVPIRDGEVWVGGSGGPIGSRPAVPVSVQDRGGVALPAVLGPAAAFDPGPAPADPTADPADPTAAAVRTTGVVLAFPTRPTDDEVRAVADAFPAGVVQRGDDLVSPDFGGPLDGADSVPVRTTSDLGTWMVVGLGAGLVLLLVGLRFVAQARRAEDDLLEVIGAPAGFLRRLAATEAAIVAGVSVALGSAVAAGGLAVGISRYNSIGRSNDGDLLPPIPVVVPPALVVALVALPLVAAVGAWVVSGRRPPVDPVRLADRMAF